VELESENQRFSKFRKSIHENGLTRELNESLMVKEWVASISSLLGDFTKILELYLVANHTKWPTMSTDMTLNMA